MIRLVLYLVAVAALATALAWLADRPGSLVLTWQGYEIETTVFRAVVISTFLVGLSVFAWSLLRHAAESEAGKLRDEYISTEHVLLALSESSGKAGDALRAEGASTRRWRRPSRRCAARTASRARTRGHLPVAGEVRPRPHRGGPRGQARPGDRARRRDPPRHPGPLPPHEEQPRADRRARRRQDRDRRGPRPADRGRRRAGVARRPPRDRARHRRAAGRLEVPRRVRGAPEGRAEGDLRGARPGHPVHGRAPHDRRRGRRRGRCRRRQPAEADARPRRAARGRRHHARRVQEARREGRRAGAPLPADPGRRADRRGHDRDPARAQGPLRGPPQGHDHRRRADRGRHALRTATSPTASCPTRRSTWSTRPRRASRSRRPRSRRRSTRSSAASRSSRSSSWRWRRTRRPRERREEIERELADLREQAAGMRAQWQREKEQAEGHGSLLERLDEAKTELERAERELDYQRAAELRHGEIPKLEQQLAGGRGARALRESPRSTSQTRSARTRSPRSSASGRASPCHA